MRAKLRWIFCFPAVMGALLVVGAFQGVLINFLPKWEGDIWWHIAVGEHILSRGIWPTSDFYSFTVSGNDWMAYEWLAGVVMALAMRLGGLPVLVALVMALASTLVLLLYYYAYLRSGNIKAAFVACIVLLPLAMLFFGPRPQLFGYIFLLLTLICLESFRQGQRKTLWVLPLIFLLWVNTHGSFVFGLFALGLYWVSGWMSFRWDGLAAEPWTVEQRRHLAVISLLSVIALTVTPYGTRLAAYPLELALFQPVNIANIGEWLSPVFQSIVWKLFLILVLLFFSAQMLFRLTWRLEEMGLLLFAIYTTFVHRRFAIVFVLVFAPLLATLLARWIRGYQPVTDRAVLNAALLVLIVVGLVRFFPSQEKLDQVVADAYPRGAVAYLRQHPVPARLLNDSDWGGYLIWSRGPEHKVFIDGRADIYEYGGVLADNFHMKQIGPDTLFLLRKYGIEACLLERETPLHTFLAALPEWEEVYSDELSVIYVHKKRPSLAVPVSGIS